MAIKNFIPNLFAADVLRERDKVMIGAKHCTREYEGEIKQHGDRVKILTVGAVSSYDYSRNTDLRDPDAVTDASQWLDIDQAKYCHIFIDDVDKRQALNDNFWKEAKRQMGLTMANDVDTYIFGLYGSAGTTITETSLTSSNIINVLANALEALQDANVPEGETKYLEVSPAIYNKLVLARIGKETMNTKVIDGATVPIIYDFEVYMSNNIHKNGSVNYCFARTKRAIAYASQITETEAYRPQKRFGDAVKSLQVWGAKVIVPSELICLALTPADES